METYKNLSGVSNVTAYEIGTDSITVQFKDGGLYRYDARSAGHDNIEKMKALAVEGRGLNTFINQHVRKDYAAKLA